LGNLDPGLQIKEKAVKYRNGFLEKSFKNFQNIKSKNYVITETMGVTQTLTEKMQNNT
jgi:hypothetical protein